MRSKIAHGFGGVNKIVSGEVIEWNDDFLDNPGTIRDTIVYNKGHIPLYRAAFLADHSVKAVLIEKGGKNYHPLILLTDARVPAVAGVGALKIDGKTITVNSRKGEIFEGEINIKEQKEVFNPVKTSIKVYTNVGYPTAIKKAAKTGADGIGILRTEFTAVRTLSKILHEQYKDITIKEAITQSSEADVIYAVASHEHLREYLINDLTHTITEVICHFGQKEIIIRTFDIPRIQDQPMGNRGIRRCIAEGGHTIRVLAEAVTQTREKSNIGIILPLVSHYSQIDTALHIIKGKGLSLAGEHLEPHTIRYGWEIESPAASQNNFVWLRAFTAQHKRPPHFIAIGTNDLTQFTMALGRDVYAEEKDEKVKTYLKKLYNESDLSVVKQIYEISKECKKCKTRLFLVGQAAASPRYAPLLFSFKITPSVAIDSVAPVKEMAYHFERKGSDAINRYIGDICNQYPPEAKSSAKKAIKNIFDM